MQFPLAGLKAQLPSINYTSLPVFHTKFNLQPSPMDDEKIQSDCPSKSSIQLHHRTPHPNTPGLNIPHIANVPIINMVDLKDPSKRPMVVEDIRNACSHNGIFQILNHGIAKSVMDGALAMAEGFFILPVEEKMKLYSGDVRVPVRYDQTSSRVGVDNAQFSRDFLKHYAHPLSEWVEKWPSNPPYYREQMGEYAVQVQKLSIELMEGIAESLRVSPKCICDKLEKGMQVMAVNCYPPKPCTRPSNAHLGLPAHSDISCLTIVLQASRGLQVFDDALDGNWSDVPVTPGALIVHVGDQLEILSNGLYKSVVHRVVLPSDMTRISIASLHSLAMDEKLEASDELLDEHHPKKYKDCSFRDFMDFISDNDFAKGERFIEKLRIE